MSAKWRALQHRHRYTYSAVVFPQSYVDTLNLMPCGISSPDFFAELRELISLSSTYSQVTAVKEVASGFSSLLGSTDVGEAVWNTAVRLYVEILFLENSLPLHRTLISALVKNCGFRAVIGSCFQSLCDEYGVKGRKGKKFSVSRAALSLLSYPKLGFLVEAIEECSVSVALDIAFGVRAVVLEIDGGSRPSPAFMEQCQEALSCLYYLLQKFPSKFIHLKDCRDYLIPKDSDILGIVVGDILSVLKSSSFTRDCLVAAGVSFCAALQAYLSNQELAVFIVEGLFGRPGCSYSICGEGEFEDSGSKMLFKGDFYSDIGDFSDLSRLCFLRGILTAVPRAVLNTCFVESTAGSEGFDFHMSQSSSIWTILFNGILPELCNFCENPIDSHFNFHALTVTQICLQQIKTSLLAKLTNLSGNYDPFPEEMVGRILRIIWNNLEDPLNQTVKQVHLIFDLLLDIHSTLRSIEGSNKTKSFLQKTASELLRLGARCKGRYVPLASLTKRLGAKTVLDMRPNLLLETMHAYIDDDICCSTTSFLKCFLECLRDECWSSNGIEKGYIVFRELCLAPILHGLVSGLPKLRSNLNTYALPVMLEVDVDSIFPMLAFISVGQSGEESEISYPELAGANMDLTVDQRVAALVSLLKVSRLLALIEGDIDWYHGSLMLQEENNLHEKSSDAFALVCVKGINVKILVEWLVLALTHVDDTLRIDAAESLFINPKMASLPSPLELSLMKEAVPLNMRCCSTAFQMKWTSLFRKFFSRVRTALERQLKQGCWKPLARNGSNEDGIDNTTKKLAVQRSEDLFCFMKWLSCFLLFSCYPSAPYERKIMAMELILIMINVWPIIPLPLGNSCSVSPTSCLYPYTEGFTLPDSTLSLVCSIIDSWDRLRESSFRILLHFPTPLPGIASDVAVKDVITWAKRLVCSPRVRESDAGALTLRLIFRKYVLELGWVVGASVNVFCSHPQSSPANGKSQIDKFRAPVIEYILSLVDWLRVVVEEGERDLSEACKNSFVHGVLLTLRYTFEELDWDSDIILSSSSEMRHALEKLLELIMRITSLALWVVSADAWHLPEDMDDIVDDAFLSDVPVGMDPSDSSSELQVKNSKLEDNVRPTEQVVMVGCWLAMKEVSLLLGTITRKIPLPSGNCSDSSKPGDPLCEATDEYPKATTDVMLDLKQLETIGNHFLEVLLKMKHNGAIDKTRAGFTALCNRLLCSNDPRLCKMTESWMEQLMERTVAIGQTVDDLLRRSAGIPATFIALFLSEPEGIPKKLLPRALRWLIDVANMYLPIPAKVDNQNGDLSCKNSSTKLNQESICVLSREMDVNGRTSKIRDEGVIPTVHAFNALRAAFNDTNLATDTSGFCAEALIISIRSFSSPYWEVRNSACLAYTALVRRMIGFLNVQKRESVRRALTGLEFFHRYPALHPFLSSELKIATESLGDGCSHHSESNMAKVVHPSLCPVLILLSRLKPSTISSETADALDPFVFMPFITRCATQSNLRVRVLASRALTGLVSNEKLQTVLHFIACRLPHGRNQMASQEASSSISFSSAEMSNGVDNEMPRLASFNSIHGILLQLCVLLDINCRNLADVSKKEWIIGELTKVLMKCSWIGSPKSCPCPTLNCSYLQVLDHMLSITRTCESGRHVTTVRCLLQELSSQCLDIDVSCQAVFYDPTKVELRRQAAASYFNCMFSGSPETAGEGLLLQAHIRPALNLSSMPESECSVVGLQERLVFCLSDASYEIRLATLKWLLRFLKSTECDGNDHQSGNDADIIHMWAKTTLQPTLMQLLAIEENPKCSYYILRILFSWNLLQYQKPSNLQGKDVIYIGSMDCNSVFRFWGKLISLNKVATHIKARETLLCCMGICVKWFANLYTSLVLLDRPNVRGDTAVDSSGLGGLERWADIYECIDLFIGLIKQNSASSEPVNMRKAAAESIVASGLLEEAVLIRSLVSNSQISSEGLSIFEDDKKISHFEPSKAVNLYARQILDFWFTCIKLLEDEDVGLRQRLAMDVQRCFGSKGSARSHGADIVPTQVEKVIESSFEFLSSIFGHWLDYFDYLSRWVFNTASYMIARGDLVRRVFDKEIDNHHEERLLICQICCFHMEKISLSKSWTDGSSEKSLNKPDILIFVQKWRMRFLNQLILFANDYIETEGGVGWIGGIGNHKDAFLSLYASLLGLYALRCPIPGDCESPIKTEIHKPLLSGLVELGRIIRPFLRNPLIYNLYWSVIQSYEKMLGAAFNPSDTKSEGDCAAWEGFNPYFLR
ncbi:uncharacterized protein LOC131242120 [Magnolia sinica]|uniref:uncharacterized protein LOC131242120 n=1 Tax=Magnolia sinica TaxID=86752 RepID=UPI0026596C56|nr:uncharacterized protein LOC131242120 [Magnolia sinica]